jgi:hypothetical protein
VLMVGFCWLGRVGYHCTVLRYEEKQKSYNHNFKTMEITGIQAMTLVVWVEVDTGFKRPHKQWHL